MYFLDFHKFRTTAKELERFLSKDLVALEFCVVRITCFMQGAKSQTPLGLSKLLHADRIGNDKRKEYLLYNTTHSLKIPSQYHDNCPDHHNTHGICALLMGCSAESNQQGNASQIHP